MTKHYDSGESLQQKILDGIDILADNVASTLGPRGRNVILHKVGVNPIITKDGVTVANFVELDDPFQNAAVQIMKQAASETNNNAGDGTTTSTVLARAILKHSQRFLATGASPVELKRGIDKAVAVLVENLKEASSPISSAEDIEHIATISANGDKTIGKLIATAVDAAGKDGAITVEEARSVETTLDIVEGFRLDSGYLSPQFITDQRRGSVSYNEPYFLVTDYALESVDELLPVLEVAARETRPFVIIAENIEGQALAALIMNALRGTLKVAAVKAPRYGEERRNILKDLAASVGATFVSRESGVKMKDVKLEHLGTAKKVDITKRVTTIVDGQGDLDVIEERIETLKTEVTQTEDLHECERIQERITRLASGVAIIHVGGSTEVEMIEKKHRVEDALEAVRSAQQEGIVAGGGVALIRAASNLKVDVDTEEQGLGVEIIKRAVFAPVRQMAKNAGESPDLIVSQIMSAENNEGWNFATGGMDDLFASGVVDPAKVTRTALQNAASVASTLITTNFGVIEGG
tara:strand:+ start:7411 stop:8982 length:1572 start_codon:yes stop_codon:yes gene_type:complete